MSRIVISCYGHEENVRCGGDKAAVAHGIAHFLSRKYEVILISGSFSGRAPEKSEPFQLIGLPTAWTGLRAGRLLFHLFLANAVRRIRPDLWIESRSGFSTSLIPRVTSKPVIALCRMLPAEANSPGNNLPFGFYKRERPARYQWLIKSAEADGGPVTRGRQDVRYTTIPVDVCLPENPPPFGEGSHILFRGPINVNQKGLDLLLAAMAIAKPTLPLVIAGAGSPAQEKILVRLIEQASGPIARVGRVSGPAKDALLRDCAFVVQPSRFENSDLPILEAMAWGKPVVHFDLLQLRWTGSEAAIHVPAFDVESLAAAIRKLSYNGVQRATMGRAAWEVAKRYSGDGIGERYLKIAEACLRETYRGGS